MSDKSEILIVVGDTEVPKFDGMLGGLWSTLFYWVRSRQTSKRLRDEAAADLATVNAMAAAKIAVCEKKIHHVNVWKRTDNLRYYNKHGDKWYEMQGICTLCGTITHKRYYTNGGPNP